MKNAGQNVTPLKSGEASEIQLLYGCREILDTCAERLKPRLQQCGQWRNFRLAQSIMPGITDKLMTTVPRDKAVRFLNNLANQEIRVVNRHDVHTRPDMIMIEEDNLRTLLIFAMRSACVLCDGSHQERKSCDLRRILKKTTLFELEESSAECCGQWLFRRREK